MQMLADIGLKGFISSVGKILISFSEIYQQFKHDRVVKQSFINTIISASFNWKATLLRWLFSVPPPPLFIPTEIYIKTQLKVDC